MEGVGWGPVEGVVWGPVERVTGPVRMARPVVPVAHAQEERADGADAREDLRNVEGIVCSTRDRTTELERLPTSAHLVATVSDFSP